MSRMIAAAFSLALIAAPSVGSAATFQTLYNFTGGADGSEPYGRLAMGKTGLLYGTTLSGGSGGGGTVFQFDPATAKLTTLYSFTLGGASGSNPQAALTVNKKGILFGVTGNGGASSNCSYGCGTIFKLDPTTQALTTLYSFTSQGDGALPAGRLLFDPKQTTLYGTAVRGGDLADCGGIGCGTVFQLVLTGKKFSTLHEFGVTQGDGDGPESGLIEDAAGILYGTASEGGQHGSGIAYTIDSVSGTYAVLHDFDYNVDGNDPDSELLLKNGVLYSTTRSGGPGSTTYGTIFAMDPGTGAVTTLYSFMDGNDGIFPTGGLVAGPKGKLYGTSAQGAGSGAGAAYAFKPSSLKLTALYDFTDGGDGALPQTGMTLGKAGHLYGVTSYGHGTIFEITP